MMCLLCDSRVARKFSGKPGTRISGGRLAVWNLKIWILKSTVEIRRLMRPLYVNCGSKYEVLEIPTPPYPQICVLWLVLLTSDRCTNAKLVTQPGFSHSGCMQHDVPLGAESRSPCSASFWVTASKVRFMLIFGLKAAQAGTPWTWVHKSCK